MDFNIFWTLFNPDATYTNRREAAEQEWARHPEKHESIINWLKQHGTYRGRNPYFFILDWQNKQVMQQTLTFQEYYAKYGTTEPQDGWQRVCLPEQQKTIYVKTN